MKRDRKSCVKTGRFGLETVYESSPLLLLLLLRLQTVEALKEVMWVSMLMLTEEMCSQNSGLQLCFVPINNMF